MQIDDSLINKNQNYINYWTAESSYKDLSRFVGDYITRIEDSFGVTYSHEDIFKREFDDEGECVDNYCVRSKIVKLATETCELYCKAILVEQGKNWGEMKSIGHNLLDCYNSLGEEDKILIESIPLDYMMNVSFFNAILITPPVGCEKSYKEEYPDEYKISLVDYLSSFATGRILPNIRARYPGQTLVDFNEQFILALAKLLHSFFHTKKLKEKMMNKDTCMYERLVEKTKQDYLGKE